MLNTPILLITFNRPEHTWRALERILDAQPKELYVFQDGARKGNASDVELCLQVRAVVEHLRSQTNTVFHTFYSEENLGCGPGPVAAISWFFENVEMGIISEDDCLPSKTLFRFYEDLLVKYKDDTSVSVITGTNALTKWNSSRGDYFLSKTGGMTMGSWASWSRAWKMFDFNLSSWAHKGTQNRLQNFMGKNEFAVCAPIFEELYLHPSKTAWDFQWAYACYANETYHIVSTVNQMSNIGFGEGATHTPNADDRRANIRLYDCSFPLKQVSQKPDVLFDWVMYQRFSKTTKKSFYLRGLLKIIDWVWRR